MTKPSAITMAKLLVEQVLQRNLNQYHLLAIPLNVELILFQIIFFISTDFGTARSRAFSAAN